jgi:choline-phosphate cytidylyltransferase
VSFFLSLLNIPSLCCDRCEAVRNCKWADGVIPAAPWIITNDFLIQHRIDYVAHDENPYAASGHEDVYALAKAQGRDK